MNRLVKRYLILFFAILIPLTVAFLVGNYGYNSEKFGQGKWLNKYREEYLSFEGDYTTKDKIDKYLKYGLNNQYFLYDKTPILEKEIKNSEGEKLFDLLIFQAIYEYTENGEKVDRIQYLFLMYNVQYLKIRPMFAGDDALKKEIEAANVPTLTAKLLEINDVEEDRAKLTVVQLEGKMIPDYDSDVDFISGKVAGEDQDENLNTNDPLVQVYIGVLPMRNIHLNSKFELEIGATIKSIVGSDGQSLNTEVSKFEVELEVNPENVETKGFEESYKQNLRSHGFFKFAFKNYLWWIYLATFTAVGLVTLSFYAVYVAEEKSQLETKKKSKNKSNKK